MSDPLKAVLQTDAFKANLFGPNSRYYGIETATMVTEDGRTIIYVRRRFAPLPEGFVGQFYRFHRALKDNTVLPVALADARASLELITATYHSAQTGQIVTLPIGKDHPKYASWRP